VREKICPIAGPGKLSASERERKAKEIIAASGVDTQEYFDKVVKQSSNGVTFGEQAALWLDKMRNRKRKPVAPSTLENWAKALGKWINPNIGNLPLASIGNLALKNLGATMVNGGLGASAIRSYTNVVKMVVASALNEEGDQLYPRKWNHDFIDLPEDKCPRQPSFTSDVVTAIVRCSRDPYRMLWILFAAAGLRIGEALGIDIKDVSADATVIKIRQKAWRGQVHDFLKTDNGHREVDLHPQVAAELKKFIGQRKEGLLFCSKTQKQLWQTNILRRALHPVLAKLNQPKCGAHAFRRFRTTWLRKNLVPKDLEHFWLGHADEEVGDIYSKLKEDMAFRQEVTRRIGFGFEIPIEKPVVGPNGPKIEIETIQEASVTV
jgi:integrase